MKNRILILVTTIYYLGMNILFSQSNTNEQPFTVYFDSLYNNIDFSNVPHGILYDRVNGFSSLSLFDRDHSDTSSYWHFMQAYSELQRAAIQQTTLPISIDSLFVLNSFSEVSIGLINFDYGFIDTNVYHNGKLYNNNGFWYDNTSIQYPIFNSKQTIIVSPLKEVLEGTNFVFDINTLYLFSNRNPEIESLYIDFDDGMGYRNTTLPSKEQVTYTSAGIKIFAYKILFNNGDELITHSFVKIRDSKAQRIENLLNSRAIPCNPVGTWNPSRITAKIPYKGYGESEKFFGKADIYTFYATDLQIHKPIIVVDGFDPEDVRGAEDIWERFNYGSGKNVGCELLNLGYEIIFVNMPQYTTTCEAGNHSKVIDGGGDYIQRNAMTVIEVINEVNRKLNLSGSQEEIVVVGPSMGGQITRYALRYMEKNPNSNTNYGKHNCRLWISFDSPHCGANIAMGAQAFLEYFGKKIESVETKYTKLLCCAAAKQMLLKHIADENQTYYNLYYNELNTLGYPNELRKTTITNGSLSAQRTGYDHDVAFRFIAGVANAKLWFISKNGSTGDDRQVARLFCTGGVQEKKYYTSGVGCGYDGSPGGTFDSFQQIYNEIDKLNGWYTVTTNEVLKPSHCFMPTYSTLGYWAGQYQVCQAIPGNIIESIPFDSYWGGSANMMHVTFSQPMRDWLFNEIETYINPSNETIFLCDLAEYSVHFPVGKSSSVNWTCSPNLQILSGQGTATITVRPLNIGDGWVEATLTGNNILTHNKTLKKRAVTVAYSQPVANAPTTVTNNQTWSTPYLAGQDITIQTGATLTITSTLKLSENIKITIKPGAKLIVDGGKLTNACPDKKWKGIYVSGNYYLPQTPESNQGVLELKNGAIIENASTAVCTDEEGAGGVSGGIIRAENTTFKNNWRSVEFLQYPPLGTNPIPQNVSYFKNCTFIVNDNTLLPNNTIAHITMWAVTGVKIAGCTFENNLPNMYDERKAIYTIDAGYYVDDNCSNFSLKQCQCIGTSKPSTFKGFIKAIESSNSTKQYTIKIERSKFQNNITGISLAGTNGFRLSELEMSLNNSYNSYPNGIYLDNCTGYRIEENYIYSNLNIAGVGYPKGIYIRSTESNENKLYKNRIYNTQFGIYIGINCRLQSSTNRGFPSTGLQFLCNDLDNNVHDIHACNDGTIRAVQGSASKGADNLFSHTSRSIYNLYIENSQSALDYYYNNAISRKEPVRKTNNVALHLAPTNSCGSMLCAEEIIHPKSENSVDEEPLRSLSSNSALEIYRALNRQYSEMMHNFYAKGYDILLTDYYNGNMEYNELLIEAMAYHESILAVTEQMADLSNAALFKLKTDTMIDLTQIRDWYDEIYTLNAKYSLAETYYQLEQFEEGFHTLALIPEKYHLTEDEMIEYNNYVSLYRFKNSIRESGRTIAELNEAEINQMISFAVASRGLSSSIAKGTLCFFYSICIEEEAEGGMQKAEKTHLSPLTSHSSPLTSDAKTTLGNITLIPNPTTGELRITN